MKKLFIILMIGLLLCSISCGGGGGSSSVSSETTQVTISIGKTKTADASGKLHMKSSTIPPHVTHIKFTISAPDMATINSVVSVNGRSSISEKFQVPNGLNRYFVAEAMNASGLVLYEGGIYADPH